MRKIIAYSLSISSDAKDFVSLVNNAIAAGWQPYGDVFSLVITDTHTGHTANSMVQPMVKYEEIPHMTRIEL